MISSCATQKSYHGIDATDLSWLFHGMPRTEVEAMLGNPIKEMQCRKAKLVTYLYDRGYKGCEGKKYCDDDPILYFHEVMNMFDTLGANLFISNNCFSTCQKGNLEIFYDENGNLRGVKETEPAKDSWCWKHFKVFTGHQGMGPRRTVSCSSIYRVREPSTVPKRLIFEIDSEEYCSPYSE
jgi:hypothetical protein